MDKKINSLQSLRAEKERLQILADKQQQVIKEDIAYLKEEFAPLELLNKLASKVVPEPVRHSSVINSPINFIARALFKKDTNIVSTHSDKGNANRIRNIALGVAEGVGTYLLTKYLKGRFNGRR